MHCTAAGGVCLDGACYSTADAHTAAAHAHFAWACRCNLLMPSTPASYTALIAVRVDSASNRRGGNRRDPHIRGDRRSRQVLCSVGGLLGLMLLWTGVQFCRTCRAASSRRLSSRAAADRPAFESRSSTGRRYRKHLATLAAARASEEAKTVRLKDTVELSKCRTASSLRLFSSHRR